MTKLFKALAGIGLTFLFMMVLSIGAALAHTGSPSMVTFTPGHVLTSADLNNALAHIHNTLTGGIVDSNISTSAAVAHSKLATPALVPKAWGTVTGACNGGGAAWTNCTFIGSKISTIAESGTNGTFCVQLAYTPTNANFAVLVTSHAAARVCESDNRSTGAQCGGVNPANRHFLVNCYDYAGALGNADQFTVTVLDDD